MRTTDIKIMDLLFREAHDRWGVVTYILEASSKVWEFESCQHPGFSHAKGDGIDLRYYGWSEGTLLLEPTWWLFSTMHKIWPDLRPDVGNSVKDDLRTHSGVWSSWISSGGRSEWNHDFDSENDRSHAHIAMNKSKTNLETTIL